MRQTIVSMVSLVQHNDNIQLYLIIDGVSKKNQKLASDILLKYHQAIIFVNINDVLPVGLYLDGKDRHPRTIYTKLFLERICDAEKILYLDSDVIVEQNLNELFTRDMSYETVAGVLMPYSSKLKERVHVKKETPYICDGVVLFNMKQWKQKKKMSACIDYINYYKGAPAMLSEGTLNHICAGEIGILDPIYNVMPSMLMYSLPQICQLFRADCYYNEEKIKEAKMTPAIIHFMNELYNRPWYEPCKHPMKYCYRKSEQEAFGENQVVQKSLAKHTCFTVWLIEHLPFAIFSLLYHMKNKDI